MSNENISIGYLENMWYIQYKRFKCPNISQGVISRQLEMSADDFKKHLIENFCGQNYEFSMAYNSMPNMDELKSVWISKEESIAFKDLENAQAALDWVEARLLAIEMASNPQEKKQFFIPGLNKNIRFLNDSAIPLFDISKKQSYENAEISFSIVKERNKKLGLKETDQK